MCSRGTVIYNVLYQIDYEFINITDISPTREMIQNWVNSLEFRLGFTHKDCLEN